MNSFKFLLGAVLLFSSISGTSVWAAQHIDCRFSDPLSTDRVIVSLTSQQRGTFYYSTSINDTDTDDSSSEKLILKRVTSQDSTVASFKASSAIPGTNNSIDFLFDMPVQLILQASTDFKAKLTTKVGGLDTSQAEIKEGDLLHCFSSIQ